MESPPLHTGPAWFQTVLASIGDAVIATDRQSRVVFLNPVAAALTGWPEAQALGQDMTVVFRIINEITRQSVENPITQVLREGTVVGTRQSDTAPEPRRRGTSHR
jgi:PAS domain S-box-containing protein